MNWNSVHLVGNIATDPELRFTNSGMAVTSFRIAVNKPRRDNEEQPPDFFTVKAFGEFAENIAESFGKGTRVVVEGRLVDDSYDDKDGVHHRQAAIIADEVAASVRWATVEVTKTQRQTPTSDGPPAPAPSPAATGEEPF